MFVNSTSVFNSSTIVALATPPGNSGVGIVRLSGPDSLEIARRFGVVNLAPRIATSALIKVGDIHDNAIVIYFRTPNSFTGEDVIELQCHGGTLLLEKVIAAAINCGAKMAQPGEFTRRALLNGKMSLDQAEALINVIHAESDAELKTASQFATGEFASKMKQIEKSLVETAAQIEAALDHPEEVPLPELSSSIRHLISEISQFTNNIAAANYIYNGIKVAILGKPNAGKSSLFNALLGTSRSIVTEIPGTTTDTVSECVQIDGYKIRFIDTAGIRESNNKIERFGIERTIRSAEECDIALVFDNTALALVKNKPHILVKRDSDITKLKKEILQKTIGALPAIQSRTMANARQLNELLLAKNALEAANSPFIEGGASSEAGVFADCIASDIQTALYHIGNITGTNATEAILDEIFSRFCLGK